MPVLIATPFAANGTKNNIPETDGAQPQNATMDEGFPEITQQPISTGGIPPERADFNGILYALSDNISHINKGLAYSFDTTFATKIGGYPLHAELVMADGTRVVSTIPGNMNNPDVDLTGWFVPYMRGSQNLADLTDVATARTNLDVYSKDETDAIAGTPNATETVAGKAKIATTQIAQLGVNNTDFITAKKLRDALNATSDAPIYACRAWVNFNGVGVVAIGGSGNISSVTDNGVGDYTVNFNIAMQDRNYAVAFGTSDGASGSETPKVLTSHNAATVPYAKNQFGVRVGHTSSEDTRDFSIAIFR